MMGYGIENIYINIWANGLALRHLLSSSSQEVCHYNGKKERLKSVYLLVLEWHMPSKSARTCDFGYNDNS